MELELEPGQRYRRPDQERPYEVKHVASHIVCFTTPNQRMPFVVPRKDFEREIERGQLLALPNDPPDVATPESGL